jgi:hypothetical protein
MSYGEFRLPHRNLQLNAKAVVKKVKRWDNTPMEGREETMYSSYSFMASALDGGE